MQKQPILLYIMGTGRSGTTILEILLSSNPHICSTGELTHIFRDGFPGNSRCACSERFDNCSFWSAVKKKMNLSPEQIHSNSILFKKSDWHTGFIKSLFNVVGKQEQADHENMTRKLVSACLSCSNKKTLLDSSKYPARALILNRYYPGKTKILCLTRLPKELLKSFQKKGVEQPPKKPIMVFIYYCFVILCCRIVSIKTKNVLFLNFEDLISRPEDVLTKIERSTGIDFSTAKSNIRKKIPFQPGHIVTGNRIKKQKKVFFQVDNQKSIQKKTTLSIIELLMTIVKKLLGF